MKKALNILFLLILGTLVTNCSSNEDKANKIIRERMSKTLYDYASYEPIETIVTEAKASVYTDTTCWHSAQLLYYCIKEATKYQKEAESAQESMDIWGPPSRYSSSHSDSQYRKYKAKYDEATSNLVSSVILASSLLETLNEDVSKLDKNMVVGWEVKHSFRCKTKGGYSTIGNYRFVIDKEFKQILIEEDMDSEDSKECRETIEQMLE